MPCRYWSTSSLSDDADSIAPEIRDIPDQQVAEIEQIRRESSALIHGETIRLRRQFDNQVEAIERRMTNAVRRIQTETTHVLNDLRMQVSGELREVTSRRRTLVGRGPSCCCRP